MVVLLVMLLLVQTPTATAVSPTLVNERNANARSKDGVLELRGGTGWLRTEHPMLDFEVRFDIRALPVGASMDPSKLLTGCEQQLKVLTKGAPSLRPYGEWQSVHVVGERGLIRVSVNDLLAAEFAIESPGGYLMFDNRKGRVSVTRSRDKDLDVAAVAALMAWRFRPALLNGSPVPTLVVIEMSFATK